MKHLVFLLLPLFTSCYGYSGIPTHVETRDLALNATGLTELVTESGAGFLKIRGEDGRTDISVTAKIEVYGVPQEQAPEFLDRTLDLALERQGERAILRGRIRRNFHGLIGRPVARINLTVYVPQGLALEIDDGSGPIDILHVDGPVRITDGSGAMELRDLGNGITITDGSGSITLKAVHGPVEIRDGSGSIQIAQVEGNIEIHDGSGSIRLEHVTGSITIWDGSGSIEARVVQGDVTIKEDGSGGVYLTNISGTVTKPRD